MSVLIIAEAGVNHNGSLARAKKMALAAKTAGADIVKYQTAVPELVVSKFAEKAEYQKAQTGAGESQLEMVRRIHFGFDGHRELKAYCEEIGIEYLSTPFDLDSIDFLASLELPVYKIPSGEITNLPYLERIAALKKPVILSTGMSTLAEIEDAMSVLEDGGVEDITLLHCNTEYPTPFADANLRAMQDLASHFGCAVGYSDHTLGWEADIAAVALGACVIEKHFTLDKTLEGPDHKASLDPAELAAMVRAVLPWARSFTVYTPVSPRALSAADLATCIADMAPTVPIQGAESAAGAMVAAREQAGHDGIVVAFGTLYAIAAVKAGVRR